MHFSDRDKLKPPTGSGRRERISVHHDEGIIRVDFFFSVQELLDIECVLGVIVGGVLVVRVLGQVVLVAQKRAHTPQLQDALAAIQHRQFIPAHKFFATMSSDELKKMAATIKEFLFVAAILIIISLTCTA